MSFSELNFPSVQELPSHAVVEIKEWTVEDIANISRAVQKTSSAKQKPGSRSKQKEMNVTDTLLAKCVLVDDPRGVYDGIMEVNKPIDPQKLIIGDRFCLLIMQRILTHDEVHNFSFQCMKENGCKKMTPWSFDLRRLLVDGLDDGDLIESLPEEYDLDERIFYGSPGEEWYMHVDRLGSKPVAIMGDYTLYWNWLSQEAIETWKNGNEFIYRTGDDKKIVWKLWTGEDERRVAAVKKRNLSVSDIDMLRYRIIEVEGIEEHMIQSWMNKWSFGEADRFMHHVSSVECGVDVDLEVQCKHCELIQDISIPLDTSFFSPSIARRRSGRR